MKLATAALFLASALVTGEQQTAALSSDLMRSRVTKSLATSIFASAAPSARRQSLFAAGAKSRRRLPFGVMASAFSTRGGTTTTALNSAVMAAPAAPVETFRADYTPLARVVSSISMDFQIFDGCTTVTSVMTISPNDPAALDQDMILDGDESCVKLLSLSLNGRELSNNTDYSLAPGKLIIKASTLKKNSVNILTTIVEIVPEDNTQLSGLYKSGPMYCSQCEAMGFRRITYYPDRPDNMAIFENVRIEADKERYPVLLSNGNLLEQGDIEGTTTTRHYSIWSDPFPKPSYLFCVVAGKLDSIRDTYKTTSGREVKLEIFSEAENVKKLDYAMESLKRSMKWDEDKFGLEYDLGIYNIVAVNDFNMGAMENKGLNVFNTAYVLADPATATDGDFELVEGVIAHEYFHNVSYISSLASKLSA